MAEAAGAQIVAESVQNTNSWGLRGAEPDLSADLRVLVLGDSYMQGLFVGDDETPAACLRRALGERPGSSVEVLNTGHLGYSPEQEAFTLQEFADRFQPHAVVLSLFANDFGDLFEVLEGRADWEENRYWIGRIAAACRARGIPCLVVPAPWVNHVEGDRKTGSYPGRIPDILEAGGPAYFDPMEAFVEAELRSRLDRLHKHEAVGPSLLFNGKLADGHFSALGCRVWAEAVATRLSLLLDLDRANAAASAPSSGEAGGVTPRSP